MAESRTKSALDKIPPDKIPPGITLGQNPPDSGKGGVFTIYFIYHVHCGTFLMLVFLCVCISMCCFLRNKR